MSDEPGAALSELVKDVKSAWLSRVSNPLVGAFSLAWLAVNYRLLFVLFSGAEFDKKFAFVDGVLYSPWWMVPVKGVLLPLALALAYIYLVPIPTERVYRWTLDRQRRLNRIAREVAGQKLLSADESNRISSEASASVEAARNEAEEFKQELKMSERKAALREREFDAAKHSAELEHTKQLGIVESDRERHMSRAADLAWRLTYERMRSLETVSSGAVRMNRIGAFLVAREFDFVKKNQAFGPMRFGPNGVVEKSADHDVVRWSLTNDYRLLLMNSNDNQVGDFSWDTQSAAWKGRFEGWEAGLSIPAPEEAS